jgi:hypothetical protein
LERNLIVNWKVTPNDHWIVREWEDLSELSSEGCPKACSAGGVVLVERSESGPSEFRGEDELRRSK